VKIKSDSGSIQIRQCHDLNLISQSFCCGYHDDDDHVDEVSELWPPTSLLFILHVIHEHGEPRWKDIDRIPSEGRQAADFYNP
jgi:hypothetical protein